MIRAASRCRRSVLIVFSALLMVPFAWSGCEGNSPSEAQKESGREGIIVAFGDSLTQGYNLPEADAYPAQLERKLRSQGYRYQVINAGINGETSSGALSRVKWILKMKPDIVILETGANDGFRGIKPDLIEKNLDEIIRTLKEANVVVVLAGMQMLSNLGNDYTAAFKSIYPRIAQKQNVIFIPFFLAGVAAEPALNLPDGIHPTAEGHGIVMQNVLPSVIEATKRVELRGAGRE